MGIFSGLIVTSHTVVMGGDSAINTTVKLGGIMNIFNEGSAYKTTVSNGSMVVHGGMASETTVSGGKLIIENKGIVSNTIISGGTMLIDSEGYAKGTVIYGSAGNINTAYIRGFATDTVISGGRVVVDSGGSANDIRIETGWLNVSNGTANSICISSGGSMHLYSNADVSDITLYSSGVMHVRENAVASGIKNYDGILYIWAGGQVFGTTLFGGRMDIQSGAEAINTTVSGGKTYIASGAKASGITVSSGGSIILNSGGKASEIKIESGGSFYINNDVDLSNITISAGGCFNGMTFTEDLHFDSFSSGNHLSSAIITSSSTVTNGNIIDNAIISSGGELHVSYGATANRTTILAGGIMHISSGATANNTNVFSKGTLYASSGGIINNTTVSGQLYILAGGTACQTYVQPYTTIYISSGGITYNTKLEYNAKMYVSSGGIVNNTSVYGDDWRYGALYILSGASANYTSVCMDGVIGISAGGTATNITQSKGGGIQFDVNSQTYIQGFHEGTAFELKNGIASNFVLYSSGYMTVKSGGTANNTTVNYWGKMMISSGGSANYIVNSNGTIYNYGGIVNSTILYGNREQRTHVYGELIISSGGSANYTTINSDGRLSVINGNINYTSVNSGGYISIESGGYAKGVAISSGGIINGFTLQERIWYNEISDGIFSISSAVIHSGNIGIIFGGSAVFTTVNSGGNMVISSGGVHSGSLIIQDGGSVTVQDGGIIDFTLTGRTPNDDYLINNLALISGTPNYTITVSADQEYGVYKLAQGANSFTQTISIGNGTSMFGSLQCNGPALSYNSLHYLLEETDGNLILRIGDSSQPPAPLVSVSTTAPTNSTVTITATFDPVITTRQYSFDQKNWMTYTTEVKLSDNGTIYFRGINALGVESEITQYTVSNIDKISPEKPIANADITIPTNKDVKVSATFSNDSIVKEYSLDKTTWLEYTAEIVMQTNGTVYFRGKDAAGNISDIAEFIVSNIDRIAPEKPIVTANITEPTNKNVILSAIFSPDAIFNEYQIGGNGEWKEYTAAIVVSANEEVFFRSRDAAGNYSGITIYQISNIDKTAPEKPLIFADKTEPTSQWVTITATFGPDAVIQEYSFDGKTWFSYTDPLIITENTTIYYRSHDAAGNISEIAEYTVSNIDKTAPEKPVASANITTPTNKDVIVSANFSNDCAEKEYSIDKMSWEKYTTGIVMQANGTVYFRGKDAAGNISDITEFNVSNIDRIAPEKPMANADITIPTNKDVKVSAAFSKDSIVREYSLDGKTWLEYTNEIAMQANGTVYFRGKDAAGNISDIAEFIVANIDKTAPEKPIASADITIPTNKDVKVSAAFSKDSIVREYSLDGKTWLEYTNGIVMQINGFVFFRSMDNAGNYSEITRYEVSNIDRIAPEKPIVTVNTTEPTNRNVIVSAVFAPDSVQNEYKLDNGEWTKYTTAIELFKNGTVYFRCKDAAGNYTETNYAVTNIDRIAPEKPTVSANITVPTNQDVIITAFFSQDSQIKEYSLDGTFWIPYTNGISMNDNGTVYFRAQDAAGNCSEITKYSVSNIDRTPPRKPVVSTDITKPTNQNVIVSAVFSNDSNVREYSLDGQMWNTYRSGISVSENCIVYFRAFDTAGNASEITKYEVSNIDRIAPEKPIVTADITDLTTQNVTLFAEFSKDSVKKEYSWNGWEWNEYTTGITVSDNGSLFFRSMDYAGNYSETVQYTVDNIEPERPGKPDAPDQPTTPVVPEGPDVGGHVIVKKYNATYMWNKYAAPKGTKVSYEIRVDGNLVTSKKNKYTLKKASIANHSFSVRTILTTKKQAPVYTDWSRVTMQYVADVTAPKTGKLSLVQTGEDSIRLSWTAAGDNVGISRYTVTCGNETRELGGGILETEFHDKAGKVAASITAYDEAGNAGKTVKKTLNMKDMTAPTQVSGLRSEGVDNKSGGILAWNAASDNVGVTQYLISVEGGKTYKSKTNSVKVKKMAAGTYRYTVVALDKAKNQSIVSTAGEFTVADVIDPKIKKLSCKVNGQTALVSWNATDEVGIARSELWCDDQRFDTTGLSSWNLSGLELGRHALRLNVWDATGNMAVKMANLNIKTADPVMESAGLLASI